jgi:hypothetical protein
LKASISLFILMLSIAMLFLVIQEPLPNAQISDIRPVSYWESKLLGAWEREDRDKYSGWSDNADSSWYYFLAYPIDGLTAMYEATGNTVYLDRALHYINNMINHAQVSGSMPTSQYKDNYIGWVATENNNKETPLYESYVWRYILKLLRVIKETPALYSNPIYKPYYDSILEFSEVNIFDKWYERGLDNIYRSNTQLASHWGYICLEISLLTTNTTRKQRCQQVYTKINTDLAPHWPSSLRGQIKPHPKDSSAYFWDYDWGKATMPGQDTSHGNNIVSYMLESYDKGIYWTGADVTGINNLLMKILWNKSTSAPTFADTFEGTYDGSATGNFQSDGFVKLGRYDINTQKVYEAYGEHSMGVQSHYLTQLYGNLALNAKRLSSSTSTPALNAR